jgi:hypothetical protein
VRHRHAQRLARGCEAAAMSRSALIVVGVLSFAVGWWLGGLLFRLVKRK